MEAPGRIYEQNVEATFATVGMGLASPVQSIAAGIREDRHLKGVADHLELLDRRRAVDIG